MSDGKIIRRYDSICRWRVIRKANGLIRQERKIVGMTDRSYPDRVLCKVLHIPVSLYQCLSFDVSACPYARKAAYYYYCLHPDCPRFAGESEESGQPPVQA